MPKEKHMGATEQPCYVSLPLMASKGPHPLSILHVLLSYSSVAATLDNDKFQFDRFKKNCFYNHRFKNLYK
ncbi:hypothetical protein MTR_5g019640 [Medicago truncatula]|uniref:Uncharacterized protein n=1 Tax=Medicago truncatula TaxID=3880 RepID=G7KC71_MEDTR|nr:hypothetical protein MTR_5g019640 [Medicago truncatula]